jgi:CubicO group peptidase (beta-lactamase class C family)
MSGGRGRRAPWWSIALCLAAVAVESGRAQTPPRWASAVDSIFAPYSQPTTAGCAVAAYQDGRPTFQRAYGAANLEPEVPLTVDAVFRIASMSKQFTALAALIASDRGLLSLDADIRTYLPELPRYSAPITARQLIWHTSGLRSYEALLDLAGVDQDGDLTAPAVLALLARQRGLNFEPGTRHAYSNSGYFLLGQIIERVSKQTLRRFAETHIFAPLGMTQSQFVDDPSFVVPGLAEGYYAGGDGTPRRYQPRSAVVGSSGVVTTLADLGRWERAFRHESPGAPARRLMDTLLTAGRLADGSPASGAYDFGPPQIYGYGLSRGTYRGIEFFQHGGSIRGAKTSYYRFPDRGAALAVLCNNGDAPATILAQRVADYLLFGGPAPAPPGPAPSGGPVATSPLASYTGVFVNDRALFNPLEVRLRDGALWLNAYEVEFPMVPGDATRIRTPPDLPVSIVIRYEGSAGSRVATVGGTAFAGEYVFHEVPPFAPAAADSAGLVGTYYSAELEATARIRLAPDLGLSWEIGRGPPVKVQWPARDLIRLSSITHARLVRRAARVVGFDLSVERAQGVRFDRVD